MTLDRSPYHHRTHTPYSTLSDIWEQCRVSSQSKHTCLLAWEETGVPGETHTERTYMLHTDGALAQIPTCNLVGNPGEDITSHHLSNHVRVFC